MVGDVFTCLLVSIRLFLVLFVVVNVVAWLLIGDDDADEGAARPVQGNPDGLPNRAVSCPLCLHASSGRRARDPQNDGTAAESASGRMMVIDIVDKPSASRETFGTARTDDEFSATDNVDRNLDPEPKTAFTPTANIGRQSDSRTGALTARGSTEIFANDQRTPTPTGRQQVRRRGSDVDERMMMVGRSAPDVIQPTSRQLHQYPAARRPASHW